LTIWLINLLANSFFTNAIGHLRIPHQGLFMTIKLLTVLSIFTLYGCASIEERYCNQAVATSDGVQSALKWQKQNPKEHGHYCKAPEFPMAAYSKFYSQGYNQQMSIQCTNEKFVSIAIEASNDLREASLERSLLCPKKKQNALRRAYTKAYKRNMQKSCGVLNINLLAIKHARDNLKYTKGLSLLKLCPQKKHEKLVSAYSLSFQQEKHKMEREVFTQKMDEKLKEQYFINSRQNFTLKNIPVFSMCRLANDQTEGFVTMTNLDGRVQSYVNLTWSYYDKYGNLVGDIPMGGNVSLSSASRRDEFYYLGTREGAVSCKLSMKIN